ncbi:DUF3261 domain-containing protein [Herbaspirillum sp. RTI4]|uniref:DUF3261 domain-containing protein n=1 Tax=Herbaspirillum sp. RTI4 TaxID=3048640 RepID=UPI002AB5BE58|nr:DUF3261 domain-containing protein [Herbaspirillum sp. RTI4]MDY7578924.1 DUF3261 domain-containing protein [Herbaspirillum sp. RTI4]MEA9982013.1 DUF3261 domain-containing protein [Herbaspirillum sp. RTI4]
MKFRVMQALRRAASIGSVCWLLAACTTPQPDQQPGRPSARIGLQLSPAALGETLSLQQHLSVERDGRTNELDTALEIDTQRLDLVGLAAGRRVLTLHYDGKELTTWRHVMLPQQIKGEDVLEDIQLTLWPAAAIRAALPDGWTLEEQNGRRIVRLKGEEILQIDYPDHKAWGGTVMLTNYRYRYRLTIESVATAP